MDNQEVTRKSEEDIEYSFNSNSDSIDLENEIEREFTASTTSSIRVKSGLIYIMNIEDTETMTVKDVKSNTENKIKQPQDKLQQKIKEKLKENLERFNAIY